MPHVVLAVRYLLLIPLAWAAGMGVYLGFYALTLGAPIGRGDLIAVAYWSLLALGVSVPVVYLPCLFTLRRLLGGWRPLVAFPLTAAALGVVPVVLIVLLWGGLRGLLSQQALLFYGLFAAAGIVVGWVVAWKPLPMSRSFRAAGRNGDCPPSSRGQPPFLPAALRHRQASALGEM